MVEREFTAFCDEQYPQLVGALTVWCGQREVAEEVVQDALARAYRDWHRIRTYDRPGAWVRRVTVNLATSRFRRWQAERRATRRLATERVSAHWDPDPPSTSPVSNALAGLSEAQRAVVVLRYYLDLSIAEVAEISGRSQSAVTSMTQRALDTLRHRLDGAGAAPVGEDEDQNE